MSFFNFLDVHQPLRLTLSCKSRRSWIKLTILSNWGEIWSWGLYIREEHLLSATLEAFGAFVEVGLRHTGYHFSSIT